MKHVLDAKVIGQHPHQDIAQTHPQCPKVIVSADQVDPVIPGQDIPFVFQAPDQVGFFIQAILVKSSMLVASLEKS